MDLTLTFRHPAGDACHLGMQQDLHLALFRGAVGG
jgi:hypothetical protein